MYTRLLRIIFFTVFSYLPTNLFANCSSEKNAIIDFSGIEFCIPAKDLESSRFIHNPEGIILLWAKQKKNIGISIETRASANYGEAVDMSKIPKAILNGDLSTINNPKLRQELKLLRQSIKQSTAFKHSGLVENNEQIAIYISGGKEAYIFVAKPKLKNAYYHIGTSGFTISEIKQIIITRLTIGTSD